ncbi:MAG: replicative DNA helicase [Clostridia bacterium]|nr:replicative DNA helicase [Clostridia bacterium]
MQKNTKNKEKIFNDMPHSLEAEQSLRGCVLMDPIVQSEIGSQIGEEDFYSESHKYIFGAMESIIKENKALDLVTLADALEKRGELETVGGIEYINQLTNVLPSSANYGRYIEIVRRDSMLRKLIKGSAEIISESSKSMDEFSALSFAEKTIYDISNTADTSSMKKIGSIIPDVMTKLDELSKDTSSFRGIKTGFKGIDKLLNGLQKSDLIILAARPGVGKTSLAMNIVENVALQGYTCAVFSLEMGKEQLVQRMMCSAAGVSMENALKGRMTKTEWLKIAKARELLSNAKIYIDDSAAVTPRELISKCRRLKRKAGLDLVMVDYIQLMTSDAKKGEDNRQQEISNISRNLKILAKELNVPVIALSQLSRAVESRKGRPQLADLRESGAIEQDADIVMFIHRPDKEKSPTIEKEIAEGKIKKNVAEIIVEKHRNGPQGVVELYFKGESTKFLNINYETGEPEGEDQGQNHKQPVRVSEPELPDFDVAFTEQNQPEESKTVDEEIF